ncbi:MAG: hypothetical protein MJ227_01320 [Bacilli bacterium]|nr:hypothetical protein [Bacilli bacterium]
MKKKLLILLLPLLLTSCSQEIPFYSGLYAKTVGNNNFQQEGNLIVPDFPIDGIIDPEDYKDAALTVELGGREDFETSVTAKVVFGNNGLTAGFYSHDKYLAASTNYNDPQFVVNSDNVEIYVDTLNDKGKVAQQDDFAFLVNPLEFIEMRNGTGSYWSSWSGVVDYAVHVEGTVNNDSDIDTGWGCEIYMPYQTFGFTRESIIGIAFGCRDKHTGEITSKWTGWVADPQIIDTYASIDEFGPVDYLIEDLSINCGAYKYNDQIYSTDIVPSIGSFNYDAFERGTYSVDMYLPYDKVADNGITIQVKDPLDKKYYFEDKDVSYYFLCLNRDGNALLGYVNHGEWNEVGVYENVPHTEADWNNFKVILCDGFITCYINNTFVFLVEDDSITALACGLRSAQKGIKYKNVTFSDSTEGAKYGIKGYHTACGEFEYSNVQETSVRVKNVKNDGAILVSNNLAPIDEEVTLVTSMKAGSNSDNGIIFLLDTTKKQFWEDEDTYYYFFMINREGYAYLGLVYEGWNEIASHPIDHYDVNKTYEIKVTYSDDGIECYIDNVLEIYSRTLLISGNQYGFRSGSVGTMFTLF